jgi:flagellar P-ring protein precursor FlgI
MKRVLPLVIVFLMLSVNITYAERIKDIGNFEGVRENQLVGYGIVIGLSGTGDKGLAPVLSIANMLQRMGITIKPADIKSKNTAAVLVTVNLPPFPKSGMKLDALVSTIGDAKSLTGGTLILTPLKGGDGKVYAVAQGPVSIGGFFGGSGGNTTSKNHQTVGIVPEGAIIEKEPDFKLGNSDEIRFFLKVPDFTTATEVANKVNEFFKKDLATAKDPSSIKIRVPEDFKGENITKFLAQIEQIDVKVDNTAKVVINEKTGTIVIGENVKLSPVAIAHGNLTIEIKTDYGVSQPLPFAPKGAETVVVPKKEVKVEEQKGYLTEIKGATLGEIVRALNNLGVTPRDLIAILQALKAAGSLKATLEII